MKPIGNPTPTTTALLLASLMLLPAGCNTKNDPNQEIKDVGSKIFTGTKKSSDGSIKKFVDMVKIRVGTIEVPAGSASRSGKLWNYLDEEPVALKSSVLGLNGFRVGLGIEETWPEVMRALKELTAKTVKMTDIQTAPGQPAPVVVQEKRPVQTIFSYTDKGFLKGSDYPPGDNLLLLCPTINEYDRDSVLLTIQPQIRTTRHYRLPTTKDGYTTLVRRPKIFDFTSMTFSLKVSKGDFLIIGPGAQSSRPSSMGHHFLTRKKGGITFETVLVLRPELTRVEFKE